MAFESSAIVGSGINPLKKDLCINKITGERHLRGTQVVLINPEDASAGCSGLVTRLTLTSTAAQLPTTPLKYRRAISICNNSATDTIFIGFDSGVDTGTGFPILPRSQLNMDINGQVIVYGISGGTSTDVRILELS
jgi:hypothetical protein